MLLSGERISKYRANFNKYNIEKLIIVFVMGVRNVNAETYGCRLGTMGFGQRGRLGRSCGRRGRCLRIGLLVGSRLL